MAEVRGSRSMNKQGEKQNKTKKRKIGLVRDLTPGPLAPKARIIPLDQRADI